MQNPLHTLSDGLELSHLTSATYTVKDVGKAPTLPDPVLKIISLFDGTRSLVEVCLEAQISVAMGIETVRKLAQHGLIEPVDDQSRTILSEVSELEQADTLRDMPAIVYIEDVERADTLRDLPAIDDSGFTAQEEAFFASEVTPIDEHEDRAVSLSDRFSLFVTDLLLRLGGSPAC